MWDISRVDEGEGRNVRIRQPLATLKKHTNYISSVAFSHLGDLLATSAGDNLVILWSTRSWEAVASFSESMAPVTCSVFSPDDQMIISTSHDGWVRLWRPADQACRPVYPRTLARRHLPVRLSARPEREGASQVVVKATQGPHRGHQWGCAFSPDQRMAVTSGHEGKVVLWDLEQVRLH